MNCVNNELFKYEAKNLLNHLEQQDIGNKDTIEETIINDYEEMDLWFPGKEEIEEKVKESINEQTDKIITSNIKNIFSQNKELNIEEWKKFKATKYVYKTIIKNKDKFKGQAKILVNNLPYINNMINNKHGEYIFNNFNINALIKLIETELVVPNVEIDSKNELEEYIRTLETLTMEYYKSDIDYTLEEMDDTARLYEEIKDENEGIVNKNLITSAKDIMKSIENEVSKYTEEYKKLINEKDNNDKKNELRKQHKDKMKKYIKNLKNIEIDENNIQEDYFKEEITDNLIEGNFQIYYDIAIKEENFNNNIDEFIKMYTKEAFKENIRFCKWRDDEYEDNFIKKFISFITDKNNAAVITNAFEDNLDEVEIDYEDIKGVFNRIPDLYASYDELAPLFGFEGYKNTAQEIPKQKIIKKENDF